MNVPARGGVKRTTKRPPASIIGVWRGPMPLKPWTPS